MTSSPKEKWPFAVLSFVIFVAASLPFLSVYDLVQTNTIFFIGMLALICCFTLFIHKKIILFPLYILSYLFTLYHYFPLYQSFGLTWFSRFTQKLIEASFKMFIGELNYLPDYFALSIILFLLLILNLLFIQYERWVLGCFLLVGYLLMLAVFNHLNLAPQVILIFCCGILFYRLKRSPTGLSKKEKNKLFLLSGFSLSLIASMAYLFPIVFPQSQHFLFTQTATIRNYINRKGLYQTIENYGSSDISKSGFSEKDTQLGGPISDDQTILFTAKQSSDHYWRVETKNYYTGKGWKNTSETVTSSNDQSLEISTNPEYKGNFSDKTTITLSFNTPKDYLPYPYGTISVPLDDVGQTEQIEDKQRIALVDKPKVLQFTWQKPDFTQESLAQVPYQTSQDEQNTQVPFNVPDRVKELAVSLTKDHETLYEKVKAIEHYLKEQGGYRYSKIDTPFTPQNADYVDYFLFDSKVGYCDNFSSAMSILLRSIDVPSRWAKGFASGEITNDNVDGYQEYTIKNSDAHSWPEVYFEGYGWVPFEPTPGFTTMDNRPTTPSNSTTESKPANSSSEASTSNETKNTTEPTSNRSESVTKEEAKESTLTNWLPVLRNTMLGLLIILIVIGSFLFKKYFFLLRFRIYLSIHPEQFMNAYTILLRKAEQILRRQTNEPLTNYALRFEKEYEQFHGCFIQSTELYERALYGGRITKKADYAGLLMHTARLLTNLKKR